MIEKTYHIKAPIADVWEALTNPKVIVQWGGGPVKMSDKVGSAFSLWGGEIWGKNLAVVETKLLKQEWITDGMDEGVSSTAEFHLRSEPDGTKLVLKHSGVPKKNQKSIDSGWDEYYLGPLKELLEK